MTNQKRLKVVGPSDAKLGRPTIIDRALAQRYGTPYVHLAVVAIDIDRVREIDREDGTLPFGWEVFLTERCVLRMVDAASTDPTPLLEDMVLSVMEQPRPAPGQLAPFGNAHRFTARSADSVRDARGLSGMRARARETTLALDWDDVVASFERVLAQAAGRACVDRGGGSCWATPPARRPPCSAPSSPRSPPSP